MHQSHLHFSRKPGTIRITRSVQGAVKANAYDLVLNGNEIGVDSFGFMISNASYHMLQAFRISPEEAKHNFGFS